MALSEAHIATRLPVRDLERAREWYSDKLGLDPVEAREGGLRYVINSAEFALYVSQGSSDGSFSQLAFTVDDLHAEVAELKSRGVVFEEVNLPGLTTEDSIARVHGNYPSKGTSELAAWFKDCDDNMLGMGQPLP
jgi:catechol 2,3-dioxygenase-like lactoylglutathione lyase family enzyme